MSRKSRALTYPEPLGPPPPVVGDLYLLPSHNIWMALNSIGHTGIDAVNWKDDVVSEFTHIFVLDLDMELLRL